MDLDDDFELPPNSDEPSPPVPERKLKRLKKGVRVSPDPVLDRPESAEFETLESNEQSKLGIRSEDLGVEDDLNSGFDDEGEERSGIEMKSGADGLGGEVRSGSDGSGAKRALDFESVDEDLSEKGGDGSQESRDMEEEPGKKRRSSDGGEVEKNKKKSKRAKSDGDDAKSKDVAVKSKRRVEKERQEHLKELHAETQRLLRETRETVFKSMPNVQKPMSSVLEKIRRRKLEVYKKHMAMNSFVDDDGSSRRSMEELCSEGASVDVTGVSEVSKAAIEEPIACQNEKGSVTNVVGVDASKDPMGHCGKENVSSQMDVDEVSKQAFQAPIDDTQLTISPEDDEDEPEKRPARPCLFEKAEEQATFLSPAEDESYSEVFGRIKKLNVGPDTKKGKTPAQGRKWNHTKVIIHTGKSRSLHSSRKRGLSTARCSFIFGRDDRNSMSTTLASEDSSDKFQRETTPARTTAKFSSSQMKSHKEKSPPEAAVQTDTSFFEILRQNSLLSKRCSKETVIDETIQTIFVDQTIDSESVGQPIRKECYPNEKNRCG